MVQTITNGSPATSGDRLELIDESDGYVLTIERDVLGHATSICVMDGDMGATAFIGRSLRNQLHAALKLARAGGYMHYGSNLGLQVGEVSIEIHGGEGNPYIGLKAWDGWTRDVEISTVGMALTLLKAFQNPPRKEFSVEA